jgi:hypothetical protein
VQLKHHRRQIQELEKQGYRDFLERDKEAMEREKQLAVEREMNMRVIRAMEQQTLIDMKERAKLEAR